MAATTHVGVYSRVVPPPPLISSFPQEKWKKEGRKSLKDCKLKIQNDGKTNIIYQSNDQTIKQSNPTISSGGQKEERESKQKNVKLSTEKDVSKVLFSSFKYKEIRTRKIHS